VLGRVLVAEDETIIRRDLCSQLEDVGYVVCGEARDGAEAVALARALQPDIAVLDVKMPVLDGVEVARQILSERSIPIVLLTAYKDERLVRHAAKAGIFAYIVKPFRANELLPAIETAVARHRELSDLRQETERLEEALASRKAIERAKGILMEREGLSEREAFARLRRASQTSGQPVKSIADAIVATLA
jgi:response regulator NasT